MTELLNNAVRLNCESDNVEYSDELVKDYLNNLIDSYNAIWDVIDATPSFLGIGEIGVYGSYEIELDTCNIFNPIRLREIHIHRGIDTIAKALGITLDCKRINYSDGTMNDKYSFVYRGYLIFQLKDVVE